jgi:hypothetical protein
LLGTDAGIKQLLALDAGSRNLPGVDAAQSAYMQNMKSQETRARSNFQSLASEVGTTWLPGVTQGLSSMGDSLHNAQLWLHRNHDAEQALADTGTLAAHSVAGLTMGVLALGGGALTALGELDKGLKWIDAHNPIKPAGDTMHGLSLEQQRQRIYAQTHGKKQFISPAGAPTDLSAWTHGTWTRIGGFFGDVMHSYQQDTAHGHDLNAWQRQQQARPVTIAAGAIAVHVDAHGMTQAEATKAVTDGTRTALAAALKTPPGPPPRTSANTHTSPNWIPAQTNPHI